MTGPSGETDKRVSTKIAERIHNEGKYVLGIRYFKGAFTVQVLDRSKAIKSTINIHSICDTAAIQRRSRVTIKATNNSAIRR